jgi:hypothetical protein
MSEVQPNPGAATPNPGEGNPANPPAAAAQPNPAPAAQALGDSAKPVTPPAAKPAVPEKYELKLPDGALVKPDQLEKIALYAKEQGFSQEQAQKYLERESAVISDFVKNQQEGLKTQTQAWVNEIKNDKEIGGAKYDESLQHANRALDRWAPPEFVQMLKDTGLANHPAMVRTFFKISQAMKDDAMIIPPNHNGGGKSAAELLYGGTKP